LTPSVPQAGENLNSIKVWYVDLAGKLEAHDGVFQDGKVTFTTPHFSVYMVGSTQTVQTVIRTGTTTKTVSLSRKGALTVTAMPARATQRRIVRYPLSRKHFPCRG